MAVESNIVSFSHSTKRPFRWERYYNSAGKKMWQASCQFEVKVEIDPKLDDFERTQIEYRQYIRGGVWFRRGTQQWSADNDPNGNRYFAIPPYSGQSKASGIPSKAVSGTGLSLAWKEDGQVETGGTERFGYRDHATVNATHEADLWTNDNQINGRTYYLKDTPSFAGEWGSGDSVEVWIELYFKGFVVEVERDEHTDVTRPIKVLREKEWTYFWQEKKLSQWMTAAAI